MVAHHNRICDRKNSGKEETMSESEQDVILNEFERFQHRDLVSFGYYCLRTYGPTTRMTDAQVEELAVVALKQWEKYGDGKTA